MLKVLILGHINCRNKGDEAILKVLIDLMPQGAEIEVITEDLKYDRKYIPERVDTKHVRLLNYYKAGCCQRIRNKILRTLRPSLSLDGNMTFALTQSFRKNLESADFIVMSGRDQLTECYGQISFNKWVTQLEIATRYNDRLFLLGCSIDTLSAQNEKRLKAALLKARFVTCREKATFYYVRSLDESIPCGYAPDPAFLLKPCQPRKDVPLKQNRVSIGMSLSGGLIGYMKLDKAQYVSAWTRAIHDMVQKYDCQIVLVPHVAVPENRNNDYDLSKLIQERLNEDPDCESRLTLIPPDLSANEYKYIIGQCDYFIGCRTHATIAALSQGIPAIVIKYSRKAEGIFRDFYGHTDYVLPIEGLFENKLSGKLELLMQDKRCLKNVLLMQAEKYRDEVRRTCHLMK